MWLKFFLLWRYFRFWSLVNFAVMLLLPFYSFLSCSSLCLCFLETFGLRSMLIIYLRRSLFSTIIFVQVNGIEAPENMPRCLNNCYNLESFWKNWHASFNKWLVRYCSQSFDLLYLSICLALTLRFGMMCLLRYMYIPLGGTQRKLLNVWVIFTFVAIWHDLEWYCFRNHQLHFVLLYSA